MTVTLGEETTRQDILKKKFPTFFFLQQEQSRGEGGDGGGGICSEGEEVGESIFGIFLAHFLRFFC